MHRSAGAALLAALALSACSNQAGTISFRTLRRPIVRSHLRALAVSGTTGTIVAAGFDGAIARSTDSGFGWSAVTPASGRRLYGGAWGDGSFWLAGEAGTILRSTNDGRSFFPEHTPIPVRLSAVIATPGGRVVAAGDGGAILERGPSGWRVTRDPVPSEAGIRALAARRGGDLMVAVGYDGLALVERGGSWTRLPPIEADAIYGLTARDGALFGCGSFGAMLRSDDGGASWNPVPTDTRAFLRSISFSGAFGVAAGLGTILATQDGGEHWTAVLTHFPAQLLACAALSPARAIVAGEYGTLLATTDAGRTWTDATAGGAFPISALACPTMDAIVAIGAQGSVRCAPPMAEPASRRSRRPPRRTSLRLHSMTEASTVSWRRPRAPSSAPRTSRRPSNPRRRASAGCGRCSPCPVRSLPPARVGVCPYRSIAAPRGSPEKLPEASTSMLCAPATPTIPTGPRGNGACSRTPARWAAR
ncbi:MAG: YCF48-related protein [Acidobacteriota bacterium]